VGLKITSPNLELQSFGGADKKALAPHAGSEPESEKKALAPQAESEPEAKKKAPAPAPAPEAESEPESEKKAPVPETESEPEPEAESEPEPEKKAPAPEQAKGLLIVGPLFMWTETDIDHVGLGDGYTVKLMRGQKDLFSPTEKDITCTLKGQEGCPVLSAARNVRKQQFCKCEQTVPDNKPAEDVNIRLVVLEGNTTLAVEPSSVDVTQTDNKMGGMAYFNVTLLNGSKIPFRLYYYRDFMEPESEPEKTTTTTTCADNFADEVVDQANVEFGMVDKDKDGCILPHEMTESLRNEVRASKKRNYPWQVMNITEDHFIFIEESYRRLRKADVNNDGCVNKTEFEELHHELCDCHYQFLMMDHNADGKISRQEAATFVSDHMSQADLSYAKLRDIFDAADVDGDKFLSEPEFCEAGPRYQGDGDGK